MYALACIFLAISGIFLMAVTGVGPFSREPWEAYYFSMQKKPKWLRNTIILLSSAIAILCTLILIGVIHD